MQHGEHERRILVAPALLALALGAWGCSDAEPIQAGIVVEVVDEDDEPMAGVLVDVGTAAPVTGEDGRAILPEDLALPVIAMVHGEGILPEPVPILGPGADAGDTAGDEAGGATGAAADEPLTIRVMSDGGGTRWVLHTAGDVMLGRRYEDPGRGPPLLPADDVAGGARRVVAPVQRAFAAADLGVVNLESVVADLPDDAGYPGKRFLIRTRPEALAALQDMSVDLAVLANNHIRDFLDDGVAATLSALDDAGIAHVGAAAGDDPGAATTPAIFEAGGVRLGVLAWSTLSGSFVNDRYPEDGDPIPDSAGDDTLWQYEARTWGFEGATWSVPSLPRRIGTAWRLFAEAEATLDPDEVAAAWASLAAVYPELQDWYAGRGHGGAAGWRTADVTAAIAELAADVDVVMVQIHSGFNFQSAPSAFVRQAAFSAIDAGADLVVAHHPHVLQGFEWYRDGLIAYSLGNFVFDQDFLLTFASGFLRTVWDGDALIEARFVPVEIDGYRPCPVVGHAARRALRTLWEKSVIDASADRDAAGDVRALVRAGPDVAGARPGHLVLDRLGARITDTPPAAEPLGFDLPAGVIVPVAYDGLMHAPDDKDILVGRSLFAWGHFEDQLADDELRAGTHWDLGEDGKSVVLGPYAYRGQGYLRLRRTSGGELPAFARPVARIAMPAHRLFRAEDGVGVPIDGPARYTLRFAARLGGGGTPFVTLELGHYDDSDPTEDPLSRPVAELELPVDIEADGQWRVFEMDIPGELLDDGTYRANTAMVYLRLGPPERGEAFFDVDELTLIEWRPATSLAGRFGAYDFLYNPGPLDTDVSIEALPLR